MCSHIGPDWDITREQGTSIKPHKLSSKTTTAKSPRSECTQGAPRDRPLDRGSDIIPWFWIERSDSGRECQTCARSFVCNRGICQNQKPKTNFGRWQTASLPTRVKPAGFDGSRVDRLPQNGRLSNMPNCCSFNKRVQNRRINVKTSYGSFCRLLTKPTTLFIKRPPKGIWGGLYAPPIGVSLKNSVVT